MSEFFQLVILGLLEGGLYAIVAAGIVLVYESTHVVSLAHGQIMAFGALAWWLPWHLPDCWAGLLSGLPCGP